MKQRLEYLDKAKGILIILMVYGHVISYGYFRDVIYCYHMPAFFVISGILFRYTNADQRRFFDVFTSRLFSFGIPFLAYEATGPITDIILNGVLLNIKGYIYNSVTLALNNKTMWFLIALFLIEVIFAALYRVVTNDKIMLAFSLLLWFASYVIPSSNGCVSQIKNFMRYYIYFAIGFYYGLFFTNTNKPLVVFSTVLLLISPFVNRKAEGFEWISRLLAIIIALSGTFSTIQFCKIHTWALTNKALSWIGRNSLIIYGTHHIFYICIGALLGVKDYASTPMMKGILILLAVAILEIPAVYVINRWLPFLAGKHYPKKEKTA